jgi:hypothetical protein
VSRNLDDILAGTWRLMNTLLKSLWFSPYFLGLWWGCLLFHPDDFKILKEFKFYLESYGWSGLWWTHTPKRKFKIHYLSSGPWSNNQTHIDKYTSCTISFLSFQ